MKLIDKDALVAEIKRRKSELQSRITELGTFESNTLGLFQEVDLYDDIISFINTLEVKEVGLNPTLEDISIIRQIMFDYNRQVRNEMSIPNDKEYCQEVLKRFKAQKGE